ncbi:hypothetical protein FOL47_005192 [Perkinsus chesapeaki]|uniref:Peptidase C1A papain C-terminal domain-containing protein n=1 Tax=Perkinsus chesapeaki TaxID=330153 RepID=A0A7J6LYF7_PERCH|nr:hypothetical protein FOL47_005192 [Perkinsus chesapeaki]
MNLTDVSSALLLSCLWYCCPGAVYNQDEVNNIFLKLKAATDLIYTSEEELHHYERFKTDLVEEGSISASYGDMLKLHGGPKFDRKAKDLIETNLSVAVVAGLPPTFDLREEYKECANVIGHVSDQEACNSCVAISAVGVLNDRLCIRTKGKFNKILSSGYVVACCGKKGPCRGDFCSDGATATNVWSFLARSGVPTGGDYVLAKSMTADSGCWPYDFPKCDHCEQGKGTYPRCPDTPPPTPSCSSDCPNKQYKVKLSEELQFVKPSGRVDVPRDVDSIKQEIFTGGSVRG